MNIFNRKNSELDPYQFDPTRSSISLSIVLLISLALSYGYVLSKTQQRNAIELISKFNSGSNSGLSAYIPQEQQSNYYLLYDKGTPIGFSYQNIKWDNNFLVGIELLSIPDNMHLNKIEWKVSNNLNNWAEQSTRSNNQGVTIDLTTYKNGNIRIIENRQLLAHMPLNALSYNYMPNFLLDFMSSIGARQYEDGVTFTVDLINEENDKCSIIKTDSKSIPAKILARHNEGIAVKSKYGSMDILQYYDNNNNKLLYQETEPTSQLPFDTKIISDYQEILQYWPEAKYLLPDITTPDDAIEL